MAVIGNMEKITIDTKSNIYLYMIYKNGKYWLSTSKRNDIQKIIKWLNDGGLTDIEII